MRPDPAGVLVVGAGPTGLTLALQAADHGAAVRVLERRAEPFRASRALIVHPRTLEVLRPLGVTAALLDRGDRAPAADLHLGSKVVHAAPGAFDLPDSSFPHLLLIRQSDVEEVLADALARRGVGIERGVEVVDVTRDGDRARVATRHDGEVAACFVAGCDGPTSAVRQSVGTAWSGGPYRQEVVLADVELDGDLAPGVVHAAPSAQGLLFLFALGEHATWRLLATRSARPGHPGSPFGQPGPPVAAAELRALVERSGIDASVREVRWSAQVPLQHRLADAYRMGPLFLAGDAAHVHSPAGGLGMNTGIQDAANLGWKLAFATRHPDDTRDGDDPDRHRTTPLLASFELERRPVARRVLAMTDLIFWAEASTDPVARAARSVISAVGAAAVPALLRRRRLLAAGVRTLGQLRLGYWRSPLSLVGTAPRGLPRAGERLGDATVATERGPARLHDLTAHPGIDVLVQRDGVLPDVQAVPGLLHTHRLVDAPGTGVVVVRPDGYVGFSGDCSEDRLLRSWLSLAHVPVANASRGPSRPGGTSP